MLADGGDALGKEAKDWLKRPVGRQIEVTLGQGWGRASYISPPCGVRGQTELPAGSRGAGIWPSIHLRLRKAAPYVKGRTRGEGHR